MIYKHNIPVGKYKYNAHTYNVKDNGDIIRSNMFGSSVIAKGYSLEDSPMGTVNAIELKGLIKTFPELEHCEVMVEQGIAEGHRPI